MKKRPEQPSDRTVLTIVLILLVSPMVTTPPAPVFVHAGQVIVHPPPEETRPAMALVLDAGAAPTLGGKV